MDNPFVPDPLAAGSKGLVYIGDLVIVYRRSDDAPTNPGQLDLPGGGPEGEETPFQTFRREVYEEFGLDIRPRDITYNKRYVSRLKPGTFGWFSVAKLPAGEKDKIVFGDEGSEYMLMTPEEYLGRKDAWPVFQERTAEYLSTLRI